MRQLTFYRQKRQDGGTRTAVATEHATLLHDFKPGDEPSDPALLWFVDLRCQGRRLPANPEKARQWLLEQTRVIRAGLTVLADQLGAGMDIDAWPLQWPVPNPPRGVQMSIVCSVTRRLTGLEIALILTDIRDHWEEIVQGLHAAEPVAS